MSLDREQQLAESLRLLTLELVDAAPPLPSLLRRAHSNPNPVANRDPSHSPNPIPGSDPDPCATLPPPPPPALHRAASASGAPQGRVLHFDSYLRAAQVGDEAAILEGLDAGLPVNTEDYWSRTLLYAACLCGHHSLVAELLQRGAVDDPRERRCQKNALNAGIVRLLQPMYGRETLRRSLGLPLPTATVIPPPAVQVLVDRPREDFEGAMPGQPAADADDLDEALSAVARALRVGGDDIAEVRDFLLEEDARAEAMAMGLDGASDASRRDLVGSMPGGGLLPRSEWEKIDWGSWPVRYARWVLEHPQRVQRYLEVHARRGRGAYLAPTGASRKRNLVAEKRLRMRIEAERLEGKALRQRGGGCTAASGRHRRWREPARGGVLVTGGITGKAPRLYKDLRIAERTYGTMSYDELVERFAEQRDDQEGLRTGRERNASKGRWKKRSYYASMAHRKGKKKYEVARRRARDTKSKERQWAV